MSRWLYILLIFTVLALPLSLLPVPSLLLFIVAGLGILPLAALIGQSVERVAEHTGERIGGLLFATFGNATELIIGIFALSEGLVDVVRASIIGSVLGNALLVLGVSVCVGSIKHGRLRFETRPASQYASLLALCIGGLLLPAFAELLASREHQSNILERGIGLSVFIAVILLLGYVASILFSVFRLGDRGAEDEFDPVLGAPSESAVARLLAYRHHLAQSNRSGKTGVLLQIDSTLEAMAAPETEKQAIEKSAEQQTMATQATGESVQQGKATEREAGKSAEQQKPEKKTNFWLALLLLAAATTGVAVLSDILVSAIDPVTKALHWNPAFVGLVFLPLIGNVTEYFNTITMALDKRMGMVLAASAGSSIQVALLVAPILVLVGLVIGHRLDLVFSIIELAVLGLATFLFSEITKDGELVWLEGLLLILLYVMMGGTIFLFGA